MIFRITDEDELKIEKWKQGRGKKYAGASGGRWSYSFTPTSLGLVIKVTDEMGTDKDRVLDLTDYDSW